LNGVNLYELRRRFIVPPRGTAPSQGGDVKGGNYLNPGRVLSALDIVGMGLSIWHEVEAEKNLALRGRKNRLSPEQQFYVDSNSHGTPDFYMTPFGPMPNPYRGYPISRNPFPDA